MSGQREEWEKRPKNLHTDVKWVSGGPQYKNLLTAVIYGDDVGRVRREFLSSAVVAMAGQGWTADKSWSVAEDLLLEGQKRGYLP